MCLLFYKWYEFIHFFLWALLFEALSRSGTFSLSLSFSLSRSLLSLSLVLSFSLSLCSRLSLSLFLSSLCLCLWLFSRLPACTCGCGGLMSIPSSSSTCSSLKETRWVCGTQMPMEAKLHIHDIPYKLSKICVKTWFYSNLSNGTHLYWR